MNLLIRNVLCETVKYELFILSLVDFDDTVDLSNEPEASNETNCSGHQEE